jgi:predicted nucleic acid-binding protein
VAAFAPVIVVDTAVWADWFNGADSPEVDRLMQALDRQDAGLVPVILTEVLQGFRADRDFQRGRDLLIGLPLLTLDGEGHVAAARLYRRLRRRGVTVRGTIDCIIAQTCIATSAELLSTDRDFAAIARHTPLRLCAA